MEACPKIGMINFEIKSCNYESTDLGEKISQFILINYQENPESYLKEINEFLKLREDAANASKDIMGLNIIKKYYRQLQFLSNRFPMKSGEQCETEFSWDHLFDEREISHSDIRYEQQCILYNIGSLHSYLGCMDKRMNEEGIRISCNHFQLAAWAFLKIRELYSSYDFTSDLNADITTFKLNIALAQAQECLLEKSIMDNRKPSIQARIGAHIVDLYKLSLTNCEKQEFQSTVGSKQSKDLKQYCQFKIFYYSALMFYFSALNSAEMKKIGEAVGYIQEAESKVVECTKMKNVKEFQDVLKYTSDLVTTKCKALKKENDFVYNEKIVAASELAEIKAASLANPLAINFENDPEIATQDIFIRLVSMQAHELSSLYSEEKAKILRQINGQVEEKDSNLVQFTGALQINELHLKELDHLRLPKELIECCAEVSVKEQTMRQDLVKSMKKIVDSSVQTRSLLDEIEQLFETEDKENRQRSDYTTDSSSDEENLPIRPRKKKMNDLLDRYDGLIKKQDEANRSNGELRDAINAVLSHLQILSLPMSELAQKLPKVEEVCDDESQATRDQLLTLLAKLDEMKSQRAQLLTRIQKAIQDDDITKIIASHQNEIQDINVFFQEQLKKHDQLLTYMNQNLHAQDNILRALADANAAFAVQRQKILQACKNRTDFVNDLISSYRSIDQLIEKANNGVAFFESLIEPLKNLLKDVTEFCTAQKKERQKFSHKNNINAPQVQDFEPLVNPYRKEAAIKVNINQEVSMDRPRLKDFLPIMKPDTWGQNKTRPNLPSFPNDVNQQFQSFPPNMNNLNEASVTPNPAVNFLSQPRSNQLPKKGPSKNPALNFAQKMPGMDNNKFEYDKGFKLDQNGLTHEQLAKEKEMEMRRIHLEQQELQLKYMQQQFQLQQKEQVEKQKKQQIIFDQQRQQQNYWNGQNVNQNYQPQFNNPIYNQQYPNAYGHGQAGSDVNKNISANHPIGP
ncbi:Tyrosine- phosphatase non-receptor type 23, partial [Brachionus plicatilis]